MIHRSDGSGTTFNFTHYMDKVSQEWRTNVGADLIVAWPTGAGMKGNATHETRHGPCTIRLSHTTGGIEVTCVERPYAESSGPHHHTDHLSSMTVDPAFQYTLANGGGCTSVSETDRRLRGANDADGNVTFTSVSGTCKPPYEGTKKYDKLLPNVGVSFEPRDSNTLPDLCQGFSAPRTDNLYSVQILDVQPETTDSFDNSEAQKNILSSTSSGACRVLLCLSALLLASCVSSERAARLTTEPVTIKLIAFNDFHGNINPPGSPTRIPNPVEPGKPFELSTGGIEYLSTLISQLQARNPLNAVVGAGDMIGASPLASSLFHDEPSIELLSKAGMEFSSVGNHEFDDGRDELLRMQNGGCHPGGGPSTCLNGTFAGAQFKYLAANVIDERTGKVLFAPYAVKEFPLPGGGKLPVAFIGLVLKTTPSLVIASGVAGLKFTDEAESANALVPELRQRGIETIVLLIHEGGQTPSTMFDDATCPAFSGAIKGIIDRLDPAIDVIVSGHTHRAYICRYGNRLVTSAGAEGRYVTDIDVTIDPVTKDVTNATARQLAAVNERLPNPLPEKYPTLAKDARLTPVVEFYNKQASPLTLREVGRIVAEITRSPAESGESAMGNLVADAQLEATHSAGAQIAFMNLHGIRADLRGDKGIVTYNDVFFVHPFRNSLITLSLTGAQLAELLDSQWRQSDGMLQASEGFSYEWDARAPVGQRVDVSSMRLNGERIEPARTYRVTVNEFLADGGSGFVLLKSAPDRTRGMLDVDALEHYITKHSPIPAPKLGRIVRKN